MRSFSFCLAVLTLCFVLFNWSNALACQSIGSQSLIELVDGSSREGALQSIDQGVVRFEASGNGESIEADSISSIRFGELQDEVDESAVEVTLVDGSVLLCRSFVVDNRELKATTLSESKVSISTRLIDSVRLVSGDVKLQEQWATISDAKRESDALVVNRNQKLQMVDGLIGNVAEDSVTFTVGERTAEVKLERIVGLFFYRRYSESLQSTNFVVRLVDGSRVRSRSLEVDGSRIEVSSTCGAKLEFEPQALATIDFQEGRAIWLTDLDPSGNSWTPLLASSNVIDKLKQFSVARIDKSYRGNRLALLLKNEKSDSLVRREFSRGFAIKGGGKLSFVLAKQYRRLTGLIGFDPDANSTGVVKLVVQVDGTSQLEQILEASEMDQPFELDIDVENASRVVFDVRYHDRRSVGDILHAVDMKLHR